MMAFLLVFIPTFIVVFVLEQATLRLLMKMRREVDDETRKLELKAKELEMIMMEVTDSVMFAHKVCEEIEIDNPALKRAEGRCLRAWNRIRKFNER